MNEFICNRTDSAINRWKLLSSVSALALAATVSSANVANAEDADRPQVWIEVGGQLERLNDSAELFSPSFFAQAKPSTLGPLVDAQQPPKLGLATEGKITFAPEGTDWRFTAALRYGRANGGNHLHHEQSVSTSTQVFPSPRKFLGDGITSYHDSNFTVDFQAGKDVGLGMFGPGGRSTISAGVRFAQFTSSSDITLRARPYIHNSANAKYPASYAFRDRHTIEYTAVLQASRNTHAIGPSLSWDASVPLVGNGEQARVDFDWGVNASLLFGRQKVRMHQQTSVYHWNLTPFHFPAYTTSRSTQSVDRNRKRSVAIPNIGGFAGVSFRYSDAQIKFGYRADFFFNAMDVGIDERQSETRSFYGPFATISIGLGG